MFRPNQLILALVLCLASFAAAQETHSHEAPEQLGEVSFPVSCKPAVQKEFNRAVALLHSFAYTASEAAFQTIAQQDSSCAMAHWGMAMAHFHQLWQPPVAPSSYHDAQLEIDQAQKITGASDRERKFIHAASLIFGDSSTPYATRVLAYERAMAEVSSENKSDSEAQVFYALALLASASPADKTHANQKKAADLLEPIFRSAPHHPGAAHYLIHAYDNAELAQRGLPAARLYAQIAPSAPHALHMPSHIFTRLGLWEDSVASNLAARQAAHRAGDIGEELHAMDYLVYAYLQLGREAEAAQIIQQLKTMTSPSNGDFKVSYASTAMPVRYLVERGQWQDAAALSDPGPVPPEVAAIVVWARGVGGARGKSSSPDSASADELQKLQEQLQTSGSTYWATQVRVMRNEVLAWNANAAHNAPFAVALMREAADLEDSLEKLPVTPGPIIPAREQLADLLREQGSFDQAVKEYQAALANAPGRRNAVQGLAAATARAR